MNKKIINLIRAVVVIAVLVCSYIIVDKTLLLKSEDGIAQMESFYKQKPGTVDAVFVGSSHIYCHINTGILWEDFGISAFDLAGAEQPFWNSYYFIKEGLKYQTPKVIVLDITTPGIRPVDFQPENWVITNNYGFKPNKNRYDALKISTLKQSFSRLLIPLNTTHGRYDELTKDDFIDKNNSINYKGFDPREATVAFDTPDISGVTDFGELSDKEREYLIKIIEYVNGQNIPLVFISSPYVVTAEEQAKYNTIFAIADEYGIPYIDFNKKYEEMELDFQTDLAEVLHLNRTGNAKYTHYIGQCLLDMGYDLKDHRNDGNAYSSWNIDALNQRMDNARYHSKLPISADQYVKDIMVNYVDYNSGNKNQSLEDYFLPDSSKYVIYVQCGNNLDTAAIGGTMLRNFEHMGLNKSSLVPGAAYIVSGGKALYSSSANDFTVKYDDDENRLLFIRKSDGDNYETSVKIENRNYVMNNEYIAFVIYDTVLNRVIDNIYINPQSADFVLR